DPMSPYLFVLGMDKLSHIISDGNRRVYGIGHESTLTLLFNVWAAALGTAPRRNDLQYLVEKVKAKLAGWKAQQLSLAGHIILAKLVIQAIPTYPMLSMKVPRGCLNEIQKIQLSFILGDSDERRHAHL
ncbi:putative ribonuclease H protein, partial [Trifolium medium]|nr:putative ribonuclease H protein [Trifolium medium]